MTISANGTHLIFNDNTTQNTASGPVQCVAWVRANCVPTSPVIISQYNVGSVSRITSGNYSITFTNQLASNNYAAFLTGSSGIASPNASPITTNTSFSAIVTRTITGSSTGLVDPEVLYAAFFQ